MRQELAEECYGQPFLICRQYIALELRYQSFWFKHPAELRPVFRPLAIRHCQPKAMTQSLRLNDLNTPDLPIARKSQAGKA